MEKYIGVDLNDKYAMVSHYAQGMSEPGTFSMVTGSEVYKIPLCAIKAEDGRTWLFGEEARQFARKNERPCIEGLLKKALLHEPVEEEPLFLFMKMLMGLFEQPRKEKRRQKLAVTVEFMNMEYRKLFKRFAKWAGLPPEGLILLDYRESFYYYAYSQSPELCIHDISLYYYTSKKLLYWQLTRDKQAVPQVVTISEKRYGAILENRDAEFASIVQESLCGSYFSSVYLIGDGFDGDWMKKSLTVICRGRRAFMGKNLFSKGACYAAAAKSAGADWPYLYMGDNELRVNVGLKVKNQGKTELLTFISAGENWCEAKGEYEVISGGDPSIEIWLTQPSGGKPQVRSLDLCGMPKREGRTTRLRITAKPIAADQIHFCIRDMGFGEFVKSSDKVWEHTLKIHPD